MVFGRLLHLGNVVIDLVLDVTELPERGGDVLADAASATPGGGFNVLAAAARQGLAVAYAGAHGTGPFAALARAGLAAEGIEVLLPPKPDLDTGVVVAIVDGGGERTFVTGPGAEARLTAEDLEPLQAGVGDAVYLSGYGLAHASNRPALLHWLARLDDANTAFFDPGPLAGQLPAKALAEVLHRADWLTCNAREAALLTGIADPASAARVLGAVNRRGGVLVRTGPAGCLLTRGAAEPIGVPGFPAAVADTNGAGDTHTGVFIASLGAGADPEQAAKRANAAAALSVTRRGPATAPGTDELDRFLVARPG